MSELHLDSLEIKNFRCFEHLVIEKLGRVNLIVGKNSVGKTCLLEALQVYALKAEPHILQLELAERDEFRIEKEPVDQVEAERLSASLAEAMKNLFFGRNLLLGQTKATIGGKAKTSQIEFGLDAHAIEFDTTGIAKGLRVINPDEFNLFDSIQIRLTVLDHKRGTRFSLPLVRPTQFSKFFSKQTDIIPGIFVSTQGIHNTNLAELWDQITLTELEEETNKALQIIDPEIERYTFIKESPHRYPMVKHKSANNPIPLRSLGEGLTRSLGIILALVNAKDGMVLIDEFEGGLHHHVQTDLWRLIFNLANRLNVQVFATTHSWDCVAAFQEAAAEDQNEEAMLIRLQRKRDGSGIGAELYNERSLQIVTEQGIEVR